MEIESKEDYQYETADISHLISGPQLEEVSSYVAKRISLSGDTDQATFNRCLLGAEILGGMGIATNVGYFASINGIPQQYSLLVNGDSAAILLDGSNRAVIPIKSDIPIETNLSERTKKFNEKNAAALESARNFGIDLRRLVEA
ncbi:hypothetical protein KC669_01420 [Candidatus Dojkabacteria bacterium]|uniref:Uncharacterized protein n=1 Tax=Candidatus Dojkabacteria bacterium TaxID=2099670 RepID=A0A955LAR5_9BACT|nr:hypothetical protein [Candidatus Dojkabacteria bacterium]